MKRVALYTNSSSLNDATRHYIDIINKAASDLGYFFFITESINEIKFSDVILTIYPNNFLKALLLRPFSKTLFWSQGIEPEESWLRENNYFKYYIKNIIEYIALKLSGIQFLVSKTMLNHYKDKYGISLVNYEIMPCYNLQYDKDTNINISRYDNPSFVYAGSLSAWQNIDETLQVYKHIENVIPDASLTLLTEESEKAYSLIKLYKIQNAKIRYVSIKDLNNELLKYKYGFLLRQDIKVNHVATPTKMNSYLASGVIPVYKDVIKDFSKNINLYNFNIRLKANDSIQEMANTIISFEKSLNDFTDLNLHIKNIFNYYFNDDKYIKKIKIRLKNYLS
jgi:hypothetical protein